MNRVLYRIGTSGWSYPHWRGRFYPAQWPVRRWFEHYSRVFDTVEINNTFYRLPEARTFERWRQQAPPGFLYAVKANRYLTHVKRLKEAAAALGLFLERTRWLGAHLGPVLYQLPPGWKRDVKRLSEFCALLPAGVVHVMEFREPDWLVEETFEVLERHGVSLCIHDLLPRHPRRVTGSCVYVRFHGAGELYGGSYSTATLRRWAEWLREVAAQGRSVYGYFNNDAEAHAVRDALRLRELLGAEPVPTA